jgi:cell division protease FtsH
MQVPLEDRYLLTRADLLNQLSVLLAGRSAEEIAFNEISTGAQNDLMRASDIARAMVTEFGMSDRIGAINYEGHKRPAFLDIQMPRERGFYSEVTAQEIDEEVKRIMTDAHEQARRVLRERRDTLDLVSARLLEKEVIEAEELRQLMGQVPDKDRNGTVPPQVPTEPHI